MHERLTVVSVFGHGDGSNSVPAIVRSVRELPGSRGLLLSPRRPADLESCVCWRPIHPLTYEQYSIFVMHCLHAFVETEFCLVVQQDGWVLDGDNFCADYYEFDYVGAPCHAAIVGDQYMTGFRWVGCPTAIVIQNGGFSLRSRRFLEAPSRLGLAYVPRLQPPLINEDIQLTGILRPQLEAAGLQFAPLFIARGFAIEYLAPGFHDHLDFSRLVGHHGRSRRLVDSDTVEIGLAPEQIGQVYREAEFIHFLQEGGYTVRYRAGS